MASSWKNEVSSLNRELTYFPTRAFEFKRVGTIVVEQDISCIPGTIWDGSVILAHYCDSLGYSFFKGKRVLEIGAGTGIPGIVAARLGAHVTLTDLREALPVLNNTVAACVPSAKLEPPCDDYQAHVRELKWSANPVLRTVSGEVEDMADKYDVVLGADILYSPTYFEDLVHTLKRVCGPQTVLLLGYELRRRSLNDFFDRLPKCFSSTLVSGDPVFDAAREEANLYIYKVVRQSQPPPPP